MHDFLPGFKWLREVFEMKKKISLIIAAAMVLGLSACGSGNGSVSTEQNTEVTTAADTATGDAVEKDVAESDLKGEGPYTLEDTFADGGGAGGGVADGDVLLDVDFEDGDGGFGVYTNGGSFDMKAENGQLVSKIKSCGGVDYANQIFYDGFQLSQGCVYTYSFDISCDIKRQIQYRLQINGGDYHAYAGDNIEVGPDVTNFSVDFEMTEDSDPAPRLVFNMGKMDDMASDPGEHNVYIDNVKLVVKDASKATAVPALPNYVKVSVNQMGYDINGTKVAAVKTESTGDEDFIICNADTNETVYVGKLGASVHDYGSGFDIRQADFSDFTEVGNYYICTAEGPSYTFFIGETPYYDIYRDSVLMLYKQRCGMELDSTGVFDHPACHMGEAVVYGDESKKVDVSGGWHDAGDYGRYVVSTAKTLADLLNSYTDFNVDDDQMGIPESGNKIPDILDEARYGLDWMLKMQDAESGGVYHKVSCLVFPETVAPQDETDQLYLAPVSVAATGDFAAIMAKASVVYKDIDPDFSKTALEAAEKAWDYLEGLDKYTGYRNPKDIVTGEYPDDFTMDERYWAAVELYIAGVDKTKSFITANKDDKNLKEGLGWADMGLYAEYDLALCDDAGLAEIGKARIIENADALVEQSKKTGYNLGFGSAFPWGSNMMVADHGELLYMAAKVTGDDTYSKLAGMQLDYLLGNNALGYCFVTGYGTLIPEHPHHRPSQVAGQAVTGMLVGGPNKNLEDPYAKAVLAEQSAALCYVDSDQSYSTNEVTIYWNSPLIYLLAAEQ